MITESILNIIFSLLKIVVDIIPSISFGGDFASVTTQISSWIAWANQNAIINNIFAKRLIFDFENRQNPHGKAVFRYRFKSYYYETVLEPKFFERRLSYE